jgi:hypothetical protein
MSGTTNYMQVKKRREAIQKRNRKILKAHPVLKPGEKIKFIFPGSKELVSGRVTSRKPVKVNRTATVRIKLDNGRPSIVVDAQGVVIITYK